MGGGEGEKGPSDRLRPSLVANSTPRREIEISAGYQYTVAGNSTVPQISTSEERHLKTSIR